MHTHEQSRIHTAFAELSHVMVRLRTECAWHAQQDAASLVPFLIEESYELVDALEDPSGTLEGLSVAVGEELGDLLYQLLFHCALRAERSGPNQEGTPALTSEALDDHIAQVLTQLTAKLRHRHPHVFGNAGPQTVEQLDADWERLKQEPGKASRGPLQGIPNSLPTLALAQKIVDRAFRHSIELPDARPNNPQTPEEFGQALFALVRAAREAGVNADQALRQVIREQRDLLTAHADSEAAHADSEAAHADSEAAHADSAAAHREQ